MMLSEISTFKVELFWGKFHQFSRLIIIFPSKMNLHDRFVILN